MATEQQGEATLAIPGIDASSAAVLVIDAQPAFWGSIAGAEEPVLNRIEHLLALANYAGLPCLATFEHPVEKKGWFPERLELVFPASGQRFIKRTYDCCAEPEIRAALDKLAARQIIVAGAETDVCILQSVLGLQALEFEVFPLEDCLFTSEPYPRPALDRMARAGAMLSTYKTVYYELKQTVDREPLHTAHHAPGVTLMAPEALPFWEPRGLPRVDGTP